MLGIHDIPFESYFMPASPAAESYMYLNSFPFLILVDDLIFHNRCSMLLALQVGGVK
jgi:hypothetical protein